MGGRPFKNEPPFLGATQKLTAEARRLWDRVIWRSVDRVIGQVRDVEGQKGRKPRA